MQLVLGAAVGMHLVNQCCDSRRRRETRYAMAKVEYMAALPNGPKIINDLACLRTDCSIAAKQHHGIDIALQGDRITNPLPHLAQAGRPVEADRIAPGSCDRLY